MVGFWMFDLQSRNIVQISVDQVARNNDILEEKHLDQLSDVPDISCGHWPVQYILDCVPSFEAFADQVEVEVDRQLDFVQDTKLEVQDNFSNNKVSKIQSNDNQDVLVDDKDTLPNV
jgi:hypothetical protein